MLYISREKLIDQILNEAGFAISNTPSDKKYSKFLMNADEVPEDLKYKEGKKPFKGKSSKSELRKHQLIFRAPTREEIRAAGEAGGSTVSSDYQYWQLRVLSKLLFDFDILDKPFNAKEEDWNYRTSNSKEADKIIPKIEKLFRAKKYKDDTPTEVLANDIQNSTYILFDELGANIPRILGAIPTWKEILTPDPKTKSQEFPYGFNPQLMKNIEATAGNRYKEVYKNVVEHLMNIMRKHSAEFKDPSAYVKYVEMNQAMTAVLYEPIIKRATQRALSSLSVNDIGQFLGYIKNYIAKNKVEPRMGHAMTILHHEALWGIRYFDFIMMKRGYKNGIRDFKETMQYLNKTRPAIIKHVCREYDLSPDELYNMGSYSNFCDWLFANPTRLHEIMKNINVDARSLKGAELAVDYRAAEKQENRSRENLEKYDSGEDTKTISRKRGRRSLTREEWLQRREEEVANFKKIDDEIKERINELSEEELYNLKQRRFETGKRINAIDHKLRKMPAEEVSRDTLEDDIVKNRNKKEAILQNVLDKSSDERADVLRDIYNTQRDRFKADDYSVGEGYVTMAFSVDIDPGEPDDYDEPSVRKNISILDYMVGEAENCLKNIELKAGKKDSYANAAWEPSRYETAFRRRRCARILIEYPKSSALYRKFVQFKNNEDKKGLQMAALDIINEIVIKTRTHFNTNIDLVKNDETGKNKINIMKSFKSI